MTLNSVYKKIRTPLLYDTSTHLRGSAKSLDLGKTHFVSSSVFADFIQTMRQATIESKDYLIDADQELVTPGPNLSFFCLANVGQKVLLSNPSFPINLASFSMYDTNAVP